MCVVNGKAYNTSPSQAFVYHPYGMLDRDQRTTKSVNSNLNRSVNGTKCNCCQCKRNPKNLNVQKNLKQQKDISSIQEQCQISVLYNSRRSKNIFQYSSNGNQISQSSKTLYTNYKRTKFNNLLICICFWLLLLQKTRALPFRMAEDKELSCSDMVDMVNVISPFLKQVAVSYGLNHGQVENFTQTAFNDTHSSRHGMFKTHNYSWLHPNGQALKFTEYEEKLPEIPELNREELTRELINWYQRFEILAKAFEIIKEHDNDIIANFLKQQHEYVVKTLIEMKDAMRKLNIERPHVEVEIPELGQQSRDLRDWIVTREHLKLLWYVKAYKSKLQNCV